MIEFHCYKHHPSDGTPIISDVELQDYAEALLADYKPNLLKEPGKINADHFIESYLGATIDYQNIYYKEDETPIAGATVFNDDHIYVFDKEGEAIRPIKVSARTILIDMETVKEGKEGFALFTKLHESGHFCVHPCVFKRTDGQLSLFDYEKDKPGAHVVRCRRSAIEGNESHRWHRFSTQEEHREHQANTIAATLAMPRPPFISYAKELIRDAGFSDGVWVEKECYDWSDDIFALSNMVYKLAEAFGVSRSAITVQLKRQGLLVTEKEYLQQRSQIAVAF